ncbi:hypothetical protein EWE75_17645 [Sphingomonas populi]|uniref:Uncharacterized protein n=1 Tax=Sphingomonas populi TaxID=2484750 RepID=A0A4Q6XSB8_9SPHN|nr:hypothetical protein [Sphingomonas populi]RZF63140.1 hypothetical protein EWE75_17645 [Sphingomonas populi]
MRLVLSIAAFLTASTSAVAATPPKLTDAERAAVALAERRGALLYSYDQAAWHGTDDLLGKIDRAKLTSGGWIVDGPADAPELVFFDTSAAQPRAIYIADFKDGKIVSSRVIKPDDAAPISPIRQRMIAALAVARLSFAQQQVKLCSKERPNTVVLPPDTPDGPILVYLLTPQPDMGTFPMGGHYRVEVSSAGKAGPVHAFANTCINASMQDVKGKAPASLFVTHLLDPTPTEVHVFTSLAAHLPVLVATISNRYLWTVTGPHVVASTVLPNK